MNLVAGLRLDRSPGFTGHQHFFVFLMMVAVVGFVASVLFRTAATSRAGGSG